MDEQWQMEEEQLREDIEQSLNSTSNPSNYRPDYIRPGPRATIFRLPAHTPTTEQEEETDQGASGEGKQHHSY